MSCCSYVRFLGILCVVLGILEEKIAGFCLFFGGLLFCTVIFGKLVVFVVLEGWSLGSWGFRVRGVLCKDFYFICRGCFEFGVGEGVVLGVEVFLSLGIEGLLFAGREGFLVVSYIWIFRKV